MSNVASYAVLWDDGSRPVPSAGALELVDGHGVLAGTSRGDPQLREFDVGDVEAVEMVKTPQWRLLGRPTLAIALRDGTLLRVAVYGGFGIVGEIGAALAP